MHEAHVCIHNIVARLNMSCQSCQCACYTYTLHTHTCQNAFDLIKIDLTNGTTKPDILIETSDWEVLKGNTTTRVNETADEACNRTLELAMVGPVSTIRSATAACIGQIKDVKLWVHGWSGSKSLADNCPVLAWAVPRVDADLATMSVEWRDHVCSLPSCVANCFNDLQEVTLKIPVLTLADSAKPKTVEPGSFMKLTRPTLENEELQRKVKPIDLASSSMSFVFVVLS